MTSSPLANRLADYGCGLRFEQLPAETVHEVKRRFIDSLATAVGAMNADAYAIARSAPCACAANRGRGCSAAAKAASNGPRSSMVCSSAISITMTPICHWSRPIPATTWRPCWRSATW